KIVKLKVWHRLWERLFNRRKASIVEFYEEMLSILTSKGFMRLPHQTPLEFAYELKMPAAVKITEKYNRVRFGEKHLSDHEAKEIEDLLKDLTDEADLAL
ncbi:MAG: DUF4129 domain-containing protein, partial [Acidobacteriota bacterium]